MLLHNCEMLITHSKTFFLLKHVCGLSLEGKKKSGGMTSVRLNLFPEPRIKCSRECQTAVVQI